MKEGMLWYNGQHGKNISESIASAIDFFMNKYGSKPQICYLNPEHLDKSLNLTNNVKIVSSERVIMNHIWLEFP